MPIYYHDFDPWKAGADRIAAGMIAVNNARARNAQHMQEMQQRQPVLEAQAENYRAGAAYETSRTRGQDIENERQQSISAAMTEVVDKVRAGTITGPDGSVSMSPEAAQALSGAMALLAKSSTDLGGGIEHTIKGLNYTAEAGKERSNRVAMNDADNATDIKISDARNAALLEREKLYPSSSRNDNIRLQALKEEYGQVAAELRKLGDVDSTSPDVNKVNKLQKRRNYLARELGLSNETVMAPQAAPVAPQVAAPATAPTVSEAVLMTNPQGQTVKVPADKVEWAKANGYR